MSNLNNFYNYESISRDFNSLQISIASAEQIKAMSYGEVTSPETINYRTFKPEKDGLFCAKIFGPIKSYECLCGKYKKIQYSNHICEKCGVEVTSSKVRRERLGHIQLASPVAHIWFLKSLPSKICTLLDLTLKSIEKVLYFEAYIVTDPGITELTKYSIISEEKYLGATEKYGRNSFTAMIGAEAIKFLLGELKLEELSSKLREELAKTTSEIKRKKIVKRLRLVEDFLSSPSNPIDMVLDIVPVIPPDLRPLVMLEGGRFATSDLNSLYRSVINRNNRLLNLKRLKAPDIVINNEKRMLQEAVDALFDNSRRIKVIKGSNKRPLKSLSDMLKGKQGHFRQNLLGKRVDYSGRSVIVVGPKLKLHQCGLPKKIALELFKPFIYAKLEMYGIAPTIKTAKRMVQNEQPEVWDILAEVIHQHPVLLNRAPTLHRLSIQAFEPVLIEGKAIQLHPLVCTAFNADFDGDQMSVHVPLSIEAQVECRVLVMSTNNILNPANGKPIIVPSKDIVLGIYYLSLEDKNEKEDDVEKESKFPLLTFSNIQEVEYALFFKEITLHNKIRCRIETINEDSGELEKKIIITTAGRLKLMQVLPKSLPLEIVNSILTVKDITNLVELVYKKCGQKETVLFSDALMDLGFRYATISGISFGKDDMIVPQSKKAHIDHSNQEVLNYDMQYQDGLITKNEKYNKVIDTWQKCTENVAHDMMKGIAVYTKVKDMNSIYMMAHSGARGSPAQIKQLAGMRGLISTPTGDIIPIPIISNLREGQTVLEYFNSTHGARKGLADTALKTANSGYLTRRLVDVSQDLIITEIDCGTTEGIVARIAFEGGVIVADLRDTITSRVSAVDVINLVDQTVIVRSGELFNDNIIKVIEDLNIDSIKMRSVLTCKSKEGICAKCYGADLATGNLVSLGEAVGIIAAQSVGEPGTQLTMRTFHVGGAATRRVESSSLNAFCSGKVKFLNSNLIDNKYGQHVVISRSFEVAIIDNIGIQQLQGRVPYGGTVYVKDGDKINIGTRIADWDPYTVPIITEASGIVSYCDLIEGVSYNYVVDEFTGIASKILSEWRQSNKGEGLRPRIEIVNENGKIISLTGNKETSYLLPINGILSVDNGQQIHGGDVIAKIAKESVTTRDITGGLPRVIELFEARRSKNYAIISEADGYIEFGKDYYKSKRRIIVRSLEDQNKSYEYLVRKGRHITVNEGDFIKRGEPLMDGDPDLHEILKVLGVEALADYMIGEIQKVYRLQGVKINNKHFEVIIRKMLQKVEITDPGETTYLIGENIDKKKIEEVNLQAEERGLRPAKYQAILLGITKASLQTESFISAASFQETTKVLSEAAVAGKIDRLKGLKENIIVGRLLPVGAGFVLNQLKRERAASSGGGYFSEVTDPDTAAINSDSNSFAGSSEAFLKKNIDRNNNINNINSEEGSYSN